MVYDDLIIGSGLTSVAIAYGLGPNNRVCVLSGSSHPELQWYDQACRIPCSNTGFGGLGAFWHGVIPMGRTSNFFQTNQDQFRELFSHFYPEPIESRVGKPWLFVPYSPIRPAKHWKKLCAERANLVLMHVKADRIERDQGVWTVHVRDTRHRAHRLWLAAGALGTPALLENSPGFAGSARTHVSDHVILYLGQLDRSRHRLLPTPKIERTASGIWMLGSYDTSGRGLITTKPARFSFATLDHGIEQRSAFGLPTSGLVAKLFSASSLGLISESLFNKLGLFPNADRLSAYAQIRIGDAYQMHLERHGLTPNLQNIQNGIADFRSGLHWPELECTSKPGLFIRGIHLHNSLNLTSFEQASANFNGSLFVADPSAIPDIGPDHHSFKAMVNAYTLAKGAHL